MSASQSRRKLPNLTALRAFEAAARHLSFGRAADELRVTQSAISHQIRSLEQELGFPLFRRLHRAVVLTAAGERYLPAITTSFDLLEHGLWNANENGAGGVLTISSVASIAHRWIAPRLVDFQSIYPQIEVNVTSSQGFTQVARDDIDVVVSYGGPELSDAGETNLLLREELVMVCSPAVAAEIERDGIGNLHRQRLLHDRNWPRDWALWASAVGLRHLSFDRGPTFSHATVIIEAAVTGLGVAVLHAALVLNEIKAGRLVVPVRARVDVGTSYYLQTNQTKAMTEIVSIFSDWLRQEARACRRQLDAQLPDAKILRGG
jgi:LysR family glycine cleavage system transcriptional activator